MPQSMIRAVYQLLPTVLLLVLATAAFGGKHVNTPLEDDHRTRKWEGWGNHRAVVRVKEPAAAAWVRLDWRLPFNIDSLPPAAEGLPKNAVFVVEASSGKPVDHVVVINRNNDYGEIAFQATSAGDYYIYYLLVMEREFAPDWQHVETGDHWKYPKWKEPDPKWLAANGLNRDQLADRAWRRLPQATFVGFQSVNGFNEFTEMEIAATKQETDALLARFPDQPFLVFPEDRLNTIRMKDRLPLRWIQSGPANTFAAEAKRNEFYAFQLGVYSARVDLLDLQVRTEPLRRVGADASAMDYDVLPVRCFNTAGVDWRGRSFVKPASISQGMVKPLWFGAEVPRHVTAGVYRGSITLQPKDLPPQRISIEITVTDEVLPDWGDAELWRQSRLRWLDSTLGLDDEPTKPFTPLAVNGNNISLLGRAVTLADNGLPSSIRSHFSPNNTRIVETSREILAGPIAFVVHDAAGQPIRTRSGQIEWISRSNAAAAWRSVSHSTDLTLSVEGELEFDGFVQYRLTLQSLKPVNLGDARLEIPLRRDVAKYLMGMGRKGGTRPPKLQWKWDPRNHQDELWVGDVNAGLRCQLRGDNYARPFMNIYYSEHPLRMPPSWHNKGRGGCDVVEENDGRVVVRAYGGARDLAAGESLHFDFNLLITPFKPLEPAKHFNTRYWHRYMSGPDDDTVPTFQQVQKAGCNVINLHGNGKENPFINYPFITAPTIAASVRRAHGAGMKCKIYYTVRELSNHAAELWALRSLDDEILARPSGSNLQWTPGGYSWNAEHIGARDYRGAWLDLGAQDASHLTSGMSRWHNHYVEGLQWLIRNVGIDGIYVDDAAYDRTVMQRVRRVMDRNKPGMLIDLHSWNHFDPRAGFGNCANLYMEHMPYLDSLWFGEDFDYGSATQDYWLVEISGIPFGLMGDMMSSGNPWLGMLYGMTGRMGWGEVGSGRRAPSALWKLFDRFGIQDADLVGYWDASCPVRTDNPIVLVTVFRKPGQALVVLGNFGQERVTCRMRIDWQALGIPPNGARLRAPALEEIQSAGEFAHDAPIEIAGRQGWILLLEQEP